MRTRAFIAGLGVLLLAPGAESQSQGKIHRIGIVTAASSAEPPSPLYALRRGLSDLGYVEGRNITLEFRFARGDLTAFPGLIAELIDLAVDIIVVDGAAAPAMAATKTIPIVIATAADPLKLGFVTSLARPGGNVTGFSLMSTELNLKRLELLRAAFPDARAFTVLFNPASPSAVDGMKMLAEAGPGMGLAITQLEAETPEALQTLSLDGLPGGPVLVLPDAMFWSNRHAIITRLQAAGRPAIYPEREYADEGGLIAYGPKVADNFRGTATYIDLILKGANPGDLPIQQPTQFEFVINLKTAKTLGLTIPPALLARADEVIE